MRFLTLLLVFVVFLSCEQELLSDISEKKDCNYNYTIPENIEKDSLFPLSCPSGDLVSFPDRYQYKYPSFNPNNNDEIVYRRWDVETGNKELWKFNFCTEELSFVAGNANSTSDWSIKDWIIFTGTDLNIWKVKSSGDNLVKLTFTGDFNVQPDWNSTGEQFIYRDGGGNIIIADEDGLHLDTLETISSCSRFRWKNDSIIITSRNAVNIEDHIGYYNIFTDEYYHLDQFDYLVSNYNYVGGLSWLEKEQSVVWLSLINVSKTNIDTGERTLLNQSNPKYHYYHRMNTSPDGKTIALYCTDLENIDICRVRQYERIYLMDANGRNERLVQFPE